LLVKGQRDYRFNLECDDENICIKEAENAGDWGKLCNELHNLCYTYMN